MKKSYKKKPIKSIKVFKKNKFIQKDIKKKTKIEKYLFTDNSIMAWGLNDNYKSVNGKALAAELLDTK